MATDLQSKNHRSLVQDTLIIKHSYKRLKVLKKVPNLPSIPTTTDTIHSWLTDLATLFLPCKYVNSQTACVI